MYVNSQLFGVQKPTAERILENLKHIPKMFHQGQCTECSDESVRPIIARRCSAHFAEYLSENLMLIHNSATITVPVMVVPKNIFADAAVNPPTLELTYTDRWRVNGIDIDCKYDGSRFNVTGDIPVGRREILRGEYKMKLKVPYICDNIIEGTGCVQTRDTAFPPITESLTDSGVVYWRLTADGVECYRHCWNCHSNAKEPAQHGTPVNPKEPAQHAAGPDLKYQLLEIQNRELEITIKKLELKVLETEMAASRGKLRFSSDPFLTNGINK